MKYTAEDVWYMMWPDVPYDMANLQDRRLCRDHADSLNAYNYTLNN